MKLTFLGAAQTVTGSKYLVETAGKKILIDCGLFQGYKELRIRNWARFPVDPKSIDAVVLTHAHLDHTGYLPLLVRNGYKGPIYCSKSTAELCKILLLDAGKIQEEDAQRANKHKFTKHAPALPLYTADDAERALKHFKTVDFDKTIPLFKNLSCHFSRSGHILGSSFVTLKDQSTTLVFSGDLGRPNDPTMRHPVQIEFADYLVLESTYGNRLHPKIDVLSYLAEVINSTIKQGGTVVIPAFAVGRAQSLLYYLFMLRDQGKIPNIPIYLDSPMAQDATDLWCKYTGEHSLTDDVSRGVCSLAHYARTPDESKRLNASKTPAIILSASGMAEGGRVLFHIAHYGPHPENTILFAGYQAGGTRGDRILRGDKEVKIHGQWVPINARVVNLESLSSHADYEETLQWLKGFKSAPKEVFITHGEEDAAESLKAKIEQTLGWKATVPKYLESFDLN